MKKKITIETKKWKLFRLVIPAFPGVNVFSWIARQTTALGPIMVATTASKLWGWRVEVIDENNCSKKAPRDEHGLIDHYKLQQENPADVVGFYCGLSSAMPRVWQLADLYKSAGIKTIAGGWHVHYAPEESLRQGIDIIFHGDSEKAIRKILRAFQKNKPIQEIAGISYLDKNNEMWTNSPTLLELKDLNSLPYPDFGLLRFAKMKIYPIGRVRGCSHHCEFCSVKGKPRCANGNFLFNQVQWLVETRKARKFFLVDDRLGEDRQGTMQFFGKIVQKYGRSLSFYVQARLETAKDTEFLLTMKQAGVRVACIGYESPIDEELIAMRKGYNSRQMLEWTKIYHKLGFFIHAMFIFGYPATELQNYNLSAKDRMKTMKNFIRRANLDTIQILRPIPLIGTELRQRLEKENRLIPLNIVPWEKYDGNYICFKPDNMTARQMQEMPTKIMRWFYNPISSFWIAFRIIVFIIDIPFRGWHLWHRDWRNNVNKFGGYILVSRWIKRYKRIEFLKQLEKI